MRAVCWQVKVLCVGALWGLTGEGLVGIQLASAQSGAVQASAVQASVMVRPNDYASQQRNRAAVGHYSRARTMCIESLEEFEVGRKYARPDLLVDPEEWRLSMISLCEQLNRLIDPKVKIDRGGIYVSSNPRLIRRAKDQLPRVADGPKDRNDYGEKQFMQQRQEERARLSSSSSAPLGQTREPVAAKVETPKQAPVQAEPSQEDTDAYVDAAIERAQPQLEQAPSEVVPEQSAEAAQEMKKSLEALRGDPATAPSEPAQRDPIGAVREAPVDAPMEEEVREEEVEESAELEKAPDAEIEVAREPAPSQEAPAQPAQPAAPASPEIAAANSEDDEIAQAIEDTIAKRLQALEGEPGADAVEAAEE